ncbi:MAG: hypothetical protein FWG66_12755 [Spirochaetes bacterium]|nr:hypothetical protein [Spirochaetota bacterium]
MNPKLKNAVDIFKGLGWEKATPDNVLQLPLGTKEQQSEALEGLKTGNWHFWEWPSDFQLLNPHFLSMFAVRLGVDARRTASILNPNQRDADTLVALIASRGEKFAASFVGIVCTPGRRVQTEQWVSEFGIVAVRLVEQLNLEIPQNVEYIKDWAVCAKAAMGIKITIHGMTAGKETIEEEGFPVFSVIEKRFMEHIETGAALGAPVTGPLGEVLAEGIHRGLVPREDAARMAFAGADAAIRPSDRKVWVKILLDDLAVDNAEFVSRTQEIIPWLSAGDGTVNSRLAPILIEKTSEDLLAEVVMASLSANTKQTKKLVLKAASLRPRPENPEAIASWLSILATDKEKEIASLAAALMQKWKLEADATATPTDASPAALPGEAAVQGLWQKTPELWQVQTFAIGKVTQKVLADFISFYATHGDLYFWGEVLLGSANSLAYEDPAAVKEAMRGHLKAGHSGLSLLSNWVQGLHQPKFYGGEATHYGTELPGDKDKSAFMTREAVVCGNLGALPCLLSTPDYVDLSVSVSTIVSRLALYKQLNKAAFESDLFLALTRLRTETASQENVKTLESLNVPIVMTNGKNMPLTAGQAVLSYLNDPVQDSHLKIGQELSMLKVFVTLPNSLKHFPNRFIGWFSMSELAYIFPLLGDASLFTIAKDKYNIYPDYDVMNQATRRASPLPPGAAINLLAAGTSSDPGKAAAAMAAVKQAWANGLLRPGTPDVTLIGWTNQPPSGLAAFAVFLEAAAKEGLLSLVWPVLYDLVRESVKAPRLLAGTAEVLELMTGLLPEVRFAVEKGLAEDAALQLPAVFELAGRGGSSKAVTEAKRFAGLLPAQVAVKATQAAASNGSLPAVLDPPFEKIWPHGKKDAARLIEDGATIAVRQANDDDAVDRHTPPLLFTLSLPHEPGRVFQIAPNTTFAIEKFDQMGAYSVLPDTNTFSHKLEKLGYLHWDKQKGQMSFTKAEAGVDCESIPSVFTFSMLVVFLGLTFATKDAGLTQAMSRLKKVLEKKLVSEQDIAKAAQALFEKDAINPVNFARWLEKDISLLPAMWPLLAAAIKTAGALVAAGEKPPAWLNRILDLALRCSPYLKEAAKRGLIPSLAAWEGLSQIAAMKDKSTAVAKAKKLFG